MALQGCLIVESLIIEPARKHLYTRMNSHVDSQVALLFAAFTTNLALIRHGIRVDSGHVTRQCVPMRKSLRADVALRPFFGVYLHVSLHGGPGAKLAWALH